MNFAAPGLPIVVGLLLWYLALERSGRRRGAEFAASRMLPSVAPSRPGGRRHVPTLMFLLATALLILALARPQVIHSEPIKRLAVMLVLDMSSSMVAKDVLPNRASAALRAAEVFLEHASPNISVGLMQFNQAPELLQAPTRNQSVVLSALGRLEFGGGTAIGTALQRALAVLAPAADPMVRGTSRVIVLFSDGKSTSGVAPVAQARRAAALHVPIFTVALGTAAGVIYSPRPGPVHGRRLSGRVHGRRLPVPPDRQALAQLAQISGGRTFAMSAMRRLADISGQLGSRIGRRLVKRGLAVDFQLASLILVLLGSTLSLGWFGRPM